MPVLIAASAFCTTSCHGQVREILQACTAISGTPATSTLSGKKTFCAELRVAQIAEFVSLRLSRSSSICVASGVSDCSWVLRLTSISACPA